ncbi:fluoride efflux transporter CrcB [Streptomyces resistomycificus]|uniref:Fluoride-specific ion channel FluC n=1 Tax=Streptomyces resistomycificus TaxID=67356 RepID=A0A0L8LZR5_9ACTN|nr:fluoride efflux transporter CrcB [Streptomyces resistomycificus]KOG43580.1 chromosome condensation protein CrcB [Streptomyces resistomycificus]KUO00153.1 chromosome condensation protein CrcB [Streptomyces resistomycificus]
MTAQHTDSLGAPAAPRRKSDLRGQAPVVAVVALGGVIGACARYGLSLGWPTPPGRFPWSTFWTNVVGCAVIGVFMVVITEVWAAHRLVRPFFGTGVLGGFTTFSTYAVDVQKLLDAGHPRTGLAYLAATLLAALTAVWLAASATRRVLKWRQR